MNSLWFCCTENYIITLYAIVQVFSANICRSSHAIVVKFKSIFSPLFLAVANKDIFYSRKFHCIRLACSKTKNRKTLQNLAQWNRRTTIVVIWIHTFVASYDLQQLTFDIRSTQQRIPRNYNEHIIAKFIQWDFFAVALPLPTLPWRTSNHSWPTIAIDMLQFNAVLRPSLCEKLENWKFQIPNAESDSTYLGCFFPSHHQCCDANHAVADSLKNFFLFVKFI